MSSNRSRKFVAIPSFVRDSEGEYIRLQREHSSRPVVQPYVEYADEYGERKRVNLPKRRIGPNDKCLCGSGLKYKKCCKEKTRYRVGPETPVTPDGKPVTGFNTPFLKVE